MAEAAFPQFASILEHFKLCMKLKGLVLSAAEVPVTRCLSDKQVLILREQKT